MAGQENYGSEAILIESQGFAGISTNTNLVFIGSAPKGTLNEAVTVTSLTDASTKLGLALGDGYNLSEALEAAFSIAGINKVTCIPVSNAQELAKSDYLGDAALGTGIYAYEEMLRNAPSATNLVCLPSVTDGEILAAMLALCKNADGLYASYLVYDLPLTDSELNASNYVVPATIVKNKAISDMYSTAVWGQIRTSAGHDISGAAVRASLMAKADANYGVPARVGGNIEVPAIQGVVGLKGEEKVIAKIPRSSANELSADGICTVRRRGSVYVTWGDHTSAFAGGNVTDELGRFENRIRMNTMLKNRWVMKYESIIDSPLTLQMRNDIINAEQDYLNGLVAIGALIGEPKCEFMAVSNPIENIVQGNFTWNITVTETNPLKYMLARIAFSVAGLSFYTQE